MLSFLGIIVFSLLVRRGCSLHQHVLTKMHSALSTCPAWVWHWVGLGYRNGLVRGFRVGLGGLLAFVQR